MTRPAHVIVVGNEKGGSGKSTTAMHLIAYLLDLGHSVGSLDLDARQGTLTRYLENRARFAEKTGLDIPMPDHRLIPESTLEDRKAAYAEEGERMAQAMEALYPHNRFLVIDSPGSASHLARIGHSFADTLITPLNDSFIDFDNLAIVDPDSFAIRRPSRYAELVWEQRKKRALRDGGTIDWVVMRNRLSNLDSHNRRRLGAALEALAARIGFRIATGLSERVIFRELFLDGLTLVDLGREDLDRKMTISHVAARQELRELVEALNLPL